MQGRTKTRPPATMTGGLRQKPAGEAGGVGGGARPGGSWSRGKAWGGGAGRAWKGQGRTRRVWGPWRGREYSPDTTMASLGPQVKNMAQRELEETEALQAGRGAPRSTASSRSPQTAGCTARASCARPGAPSSARDPGPGPRPRRVSTSPLTGARPGLDRAGRSARRTRPPQPPARPARPRPSAAAAGPPPARPGPPLPGRPGSRQLRAPGPPPPQPGAEPSPPRPRAQARWAGTPAAPGGRRAGAEARWARRPHPDRVPGLRMRRPRPGPRGSHWRLNVGGGESALARTHSDSRRKPGLFVFTEHTGRPRPPPPSGRPAGRDVGDRCHPEPATRHQPVPAQAASHGSPPPRLHQPTDPINTEISVHSRGAHRAPSHKLK